MATQKLIIDVITKNTHRLNKIERAIGRTNRSLGKTGKFAATAGKLIAGAFAIQQILKFATVFKNINAEFENYENKLRLITKGEEDRSRVFKNLVQMAKENRTAFADTAELYVKLRITTEALGVSEERVANVTSKLSRALVLAGADGNTASSVIRQFGQAMASGEVRGDEFRSLVEGLGPALAIMARETGINVGQLRKMSQTGKLNAMVMFEMLENSKAIDEEFEKMLPTIDNLETALGDSWGRAIKEVNNAIRATDLYKKTLVSLIDFLDDAVEGRPLKDLSIEQLEAAATAGDLEKVYKELVHRKKEFLSLGPLDIFPGIYLAITEGKNIVTVQKEMNDGLDELMLTVEEAIKGNNKLALAAEELNKQYPEYADHIRRLLPIHEAETKAMKDKDAAMAEAKVALQKLKDANKGFMDEMRQLNETHNEEILRIRDERLKRIDALLAKEVLKEKEAEELKTEITKRAAKDREKIEQDAADKARENHIKNIDLIRAGKIQEIDIENMTAKQKTEITYEATRSILEQTATMNKKAFVAFKALRIAEAVIEGKRAVLAAFAKGTSIGGPVLGFVFGAAAAAYTASQINAIRGMQYQGREKGGPVQQGRGYIVGESGPEFFSPGKSGNIIPNDQMGTNVTINFNVTAVDSRSFDDLLEQRRNTIVGVINQAMNERGRRGLTA